MTDDVGDLRDEAVVVAHLQAHTQVVADEDHVEGLGGEFVGVLSGIGLHAHPFRAYGQDHVVADRTALDIERPDNAAAGVDVADIAVGPGHGGLEEIVLADEIRDEGALGFFVERFGARDLFDPAAPEHRHPIGHHHGFLLVVSDVDDGDPEFLVDAAYLELHLLAQSTIERAQGFVHQHQFRLEHQRSGNGHALLLATGKLARAPVLEPLQLHEAKRAAHPLDALGGGRSPNLQGKREVSAHGDVGEQRVVLEYHTDVALVRRQVVDRGAVHQDFARRGLFEPGEHHQAGGLARSGRAEQGQELTLVDAQVQILDDARPAVIALLDVAVFDVGHGGFHRLPHNHLPRRTGRCCFRASTSRPASSSTMIASTCSCRTNPSF